MNHTRRLFLQSAAALAASRPIAAQASKESGISLAAWSFSGSFFQNRWKLLDLPAILADKLGIRALEHVNQFFENPTLTYLQKLKRACNEHGIRSTILMVDSQGSTAAEEAADRRQAAIAHRKWIDIAQYLECRSVRINMYGGKQDWKQDPDLVLRAAETIHRLLDYAQGSGLDILVENHGGASSDPDTLVALVKKVNHPNFALLCDLGNWNKGEDRYGAVKKVLPYARGLSVKGTWGSNTDPAFDAEKLVRTALEGGYTGWWGLEVTPRRVPGSQQRTAEEQFSQEVQIVLEAKAIVERVVLKKG